MKKSLIFSFSFIGKIGFSVAIPLLLFALAGRALDRVFHTPPYIFLLCLALATVLIFFILKKIIKDALESLNHGN